MWIAGCGTPSTLTLTRSVSNMVIYSCRLCDQTRPNLRKLSKHIKHNHNTDIKSYYDKFIKKHDEGFCVICKIGRAHV